MWVCRYQCRYGLTYIQTHTYTVICLFLFVCLSIFQSIHLSTYLFTFPSIYLPICLSTYIDRSPYQPTLVYLSASPPISIDLPLYLPIYLPTKLPTYLSIYPSLYLPTFLSIYKSTHDYTSIYQPTSIQRKWQSYRSLFNIHDFRNVQMEETVISRRKGNFSVCIVLLLCVNYGCVCKYVSKRRFSSCYWS